MMKFKIVENGSNFNPAEWFGESAVEVKEWDDFIIDPPTESAPPTVDELYERLGELREKRKGEKAQLEHFRSIHTGLLPEKKAAFVRNNVTALRERIQHLDFEIDWIKDELKTIERSVKWEVMRGKGYSFGRLLDATRPPKGTPKQKLSVGREKDGKQTFYRMTKDGKTKRF